MVASKERREMEETLELEKCRSQAASQVQARWVPRVAEAVEELLKPVDAPPGTRDGWPWQLNLDLWANQRRVGESKKMRVQ
eukprot:symbB.v1.2.014281.t1/scaffold1042.1/size142359/5